MKEVAARILDHRPVSSAFRVLTLATPGLSVAKPGQFVQLLCRRPEETDPFLRRPFSVMSARRGRLEILYKIVGRATAGMTAWRKGETVSVLGPLGNTFSRTTKPALVVAGGTGIGGVHFLVQSLTKPTLVFGVRTGDEIPRATLKRLDVPTWITREDRNELVTNRLEKMDLSGFAACYVCGPTAMIKAVIERVQGRIPRIEISLEEMMGCGFGVCYTCPVRRSDGRGYYRVCHDGPVFDTGAVVL